MKKTVLKFIYASFFILSYVSCGVKGRPEPPLRSQLAAQATEEKPPVTFATDKSVTKPKAPAKKKNGK